MFEKKKVVPQADLAETNLQLKRIADGIEVYLTRVHQIDLHATSDDMTPADLERFDGMSGVEEEFMAAIEMLEVEGVKVPAAAYKLVGLDAPVPETEPTEYEMTRRQVRPEDRAAGGQAANDDGDAGADVDAGSMDEPVTARRPD